MNAQIRKLFIALLVMMLTLMGAMTYHQFIAAPQLNANDHNRRITDAYWGKERGKIVAGDLILAESVATGTKTSLKYLRSYPQGTAYAHLTGYFPAAVQGQVTELEKEVGSVLSGTSGSMWVQRLQDIFIGSQPQGGNVSLTIDPQVQAAMVEALQGRTGAAVAIRPQTGEILGLYSNPSFDPNALSAMDSATVLQAFNTLQNDPARPLVNRALSELYPPGSVFKIVTTAALLGQDKVTPDTQVDAPDQLELPQTQHKLVNYAGESCGNGKVTLAYAFSRSCNTPFGALGMDLGGQTLKAQAEAFGFGTTPQIPLTGAPSAFPLPTAPSFLANAAIGQQDVRVTPLQIAMVSAAVANHGIVMEPYLINQELSPDFRVLKQYSPTQLSVAMTPEVAHTLSQLMQQVVTEGTGRRAALANIQVAGKTGTAETGQGQGRDLWFTGFAPADNPRIAVALVLEDPAGQGTGGTVAAPLARQIIAAGVQ